MNIKLILLVLIMFPITAWSMSDEEIVRIYAEVQNYHYRYGNVGIPKPELQSRLDSIRERLKEALEQKPNDPRLWVVLGRSSFAYIYTYEYSDEDKQNKIKMDNIRSKQTQHKKNMAKELQRAFELELSNAPEQPHLECGLFGDGRSLGTYEALLVSRIALEKCGVESPGAEADARFSIATGMAKLGRLDEAKAELEMMKEIFSDADWVLESIQEYDTYVEKLASEAAAKKK